MRLAKRTLVDGCDNFCKTSDTSARNVAMICQGIQSRTGTALVGGLWSLKRMFSRDINGFGDVDDEPLLLLVVLH